MPKNKPIAKVLTNTKWREGWRPRLPLSVLAIDPGTRRMGIAAFDRQDLLLANVRDFGYQPSTESLIECATNAVERQLRALWPEVVVIEQTYFWKNKNATKLIAVGNAIKELARKYDARVVEYSAKTARLIVCHNGHATKREVAETVALRYPELKIYLDQPWPLKDPFWGHSFDAVTVGLAHLIALKVAPPLRPAA